MAFDIGTARGTIQMQYDGKGVADAEKDIDGLQKGTSKGSQAMDTMGRNAGRAGLVIAGGLAAGVAAAANFEQRLSAIKAVSGATEGQMAKLSDKALQLGADTQFSAGESAAAMEELIKSGLSVKDVLNGAADATVALAAAGSVDMQTAASISSNAMNQFGLTAKDMSATVDTIAGSANASAIDVTDFGQSLSQVGAVAHLAGVGFDDTATAIALLGNAGIKGSDAGTSLKSMFARLQPTTVKTEKLFKKLGLTTEDGSNKFYDAQGNLKDLSKVSGILQDSLKGMTKEQKQAALQTLFGSDAIRAAAVLSDKGAKGFDKMAKSIGKVSAADVAKTRMDNFKGSIEQLMGSVETLGITLGTILLPTLRKIVDALTGMVNWLGSLSSGQQKAIVAALAFVAAALLVFSAIIKISRGIVVINAALTVLKGSFIATWAAALGPPLLIIAIIAAIGIALVLLWKKSETFRNIVKGVWNAVKAAAKAVADWFTGTIVPSWSKAWDQLKTGITAVKNFFKNAWDAIKNGVSNAWSAIKGAVSSGINAVKNTAENVFNGVKSFFQGAWEAIKGIFTGALSAVKSVVSTGLNNIKTNFSNAWNAIKTTVQNGISNVVNFFKGLPGKIVSALSTLQSTMVSMGGDIIQGLIDGVVNAAGQLADAAINAVKGALDAAKKWAHIGSPSRRAAEEIGVPLIQGVAVGVEAGAKAAKIKIVGVLQGLFDGLPRDIGPLESDMAADIQTLMERVVDHYDKQSERAQKVIIERLAKRRKALEKALKESKDTDSKVDDKRNQAALDKLDKQERKAIQRTEERYAAMSKAARKAISKITDAMIANAQAMDANNAKLDEARSKLEELQNTANDFARGVAESFAKFGDIVGLGIREMGDKTVVTTEGILEDLRKRVQDAAKFAMLISQLTAAGLNQSTIEQLLAAGVEGGLATAEAIAAGGASAIQEVNDLTGQLTTIGTTLGGNLAQQFYGYGINAAQALVDGLVIDQAALQAQAVKLASDLATAVGNEAQKKGKEAGGRAIQGLVEGLVDDGGQLNHAGKKVAKELVRAFKDELGIHSPSKVMMSVGQMLGLGLAKGIAASERYVVKATDALGVAAQDSVESGAIGAAITASMDPLMLGMRSMTPMLPLAPASTVDAVSANLSPLFDVKVYIGDKELTDQVRVVVGETLAPLGRMSRQGAL